MRISLIGGGAKLHLKSLFHGHYGKFFVSGHRYRHIFKYFKINKKNDIGACKNNYHPELAASLAADVKEAYKGVGSQSISGACHRQKCATICTVSGKEVLDKVGWAFSPTMKLCWGRNHNLQKAISYASRKATRHVRGDLVPAFTLAEILITLGIIGIVAAMTLPTLIGKYQKSVVSARNKKFVSSINQAILTSTVYNGEPSTWTKQIAFGNPEALYNWFNQYIAQYMKILKDCSKNSVECIGEYKYCDLTDCRKATYLGTVGVFYILNDGSLISAVTGGGRDENNMTNTLALHIKFDANGYTGPNQLGQDIFSYRLSINNKKFYITCDTHKNKTGGSISIDNNRQTLIESCRTNPQTCSCLLMKDNFEFKDDYPFKL